MAPVRHPLQGTRNVLRFNWPFYVGAAAGALLAEGAVRLAPKPSKPLLRAGQCLGVAAALASVTATYWVYDASGYYQLRWLGEALRASGFERDRALRVVNLNAGFDELTEHLRWRYPAAEVVPVDFYDPTRHTERSIARARRAYPAPVETVTLADPTDLERLPLADLILAALSAHEVRDESERVTFFSALGRCLEPGGRIVLVEHLRDVPNALAYTLGVGHFHSRATWQRTFSAAGLRVLDERRHTPFLRVITLAP